VPNRLLQDDGVDLLDPCLEEFHHDPSGDLAKGDGDQPGEEAPDLARSLGAGKVGKIGAWGANGDEHPHPPRGEEVVTQGDGEGLDALHMFQEVVQAPAQPPHAPVAGEDAFRGKVDDASLLQDLTEVGELALHQERLAAPEDSPQGLPQEIEGGRLVEPREVHTGNDCAQRRLGIQPVHGTGLLVKAGPEREVPLDLEDLEEDLTERTLREPPDGCGTEPAQDWLQVKPGKETASPRGTFQVSPQEPWQEQILPGGEGQRAAWPQKASAEVEGGRDHQHVEIALVVHDDEGGGVVLVVPQPLHPDLQEDPDPEEKGSPEEVVEKARVSHLRPCRQPMRRVLFAVGSWGLGHATRSLPLIQGLVAAGCSVTVVSTGRALTLLRQELGNRCTYLDWPDVPQPLGRSATAFYLKTALALPRFFATFWDEHRRLLHLLHRERYDLIVSDNRYGIQHREIPTFHVLHGLRFIAPGRARAIELLLEYFNFRWFAPVRGFLIPDEEEDGLSGDLSHRLRFFPRERLHYIGILSSLRRLPVEEEIDVFISISGPEPQRTILERIVLPQAQRLPGRVVVALGRPEISTMTRLGNVEVYTYLPRRAQEALMNRSKVVVARSGYTTIMELAALGKRALLIPTPGQTEQVYLASYHMQRGTAYAAWQHRLDLARDLPKALRTSGLHARSTTAEAVQRFLSIVLGGSPVL